MGRGEKTAAPPAPADSAGNNDTASEVTEVTHEPAENAISTQRRPL